MTQIADMLEQVTGLHLRRPLVFFDLETLLEPRMMLVIESSGGGGGREDSGDTLFRSR